MKCHNCGIKNPLSAKYCLSCGRKLEPPMDEFGTKHITLGDYEVADYDNTPESLTLPDIDPEEPIIDRDSSFPPIQADGNSKKPFINLMLIGLLFLIVTLSYFGVNAVGKIRQDKESDLIRQVQVQKEVEIKARKESYLKTYREFIILSQAQAEDFKVNLTELESIENSRWLTNIFLGGIFNGMIERFTGTQSYIAMVNRSKTLKNSIKALAEPSDDLAPLYSKAQLLNEAGQDITDVFTGELDETAIDTIAGLLADYENSLREAEELEGA